MRRQRERGWIVQSLWAAVRTSAFAWSEVKPWEVCELRKGRANLGVIRTPSLRGGKERYGARVQAVNPGRRPLPWFR